VLSTHSIVRSSWIVRSSSPLGGQWVGHSRTTWSTVCSTLHSQAAERSISHLCKHGRKRPTPVRRRWIPYPICVKVRHRCRTHAVLGKAIPERSVGYQSTESVIALATRGLHCLAANSRFFRNSSYAFSLCCIRRWQSINGFTCKKAKALPISLAKVPTFHQISAGKNFQLRWRYERVGSVLWPRKLS